MAFRKLLFLVSVILPIFSAKFKLAGGALHSEEATAAFKPEDDPVSLSKAAELKLHRLKSKMASLETSIEDQTDELRRKDGGIKHLERLIEEKSNILTSLQTKSQSFEGSLDAEQIEEIKTRVNELEQQVVKIKKEIEAQNKKKNALEARANVAEKKIEELNLKLENLQRINDEQKSRVRKIQHALQVAEEEMLKAKVEASSVSKQLKEVNQAWLPPWFSAHLVHCQSFVSTHWNEIGRPALDQLIQKALKQKYEIEKGLQYYWEILKLDQKCFQTIKEQYDIIVDEFYPLMQSFSAQAIDYYYLAQSTIKPHIVNITETMSPCFQEAKMFVMPYANQVLEITKPHLDKVQLFLKPYSKKVVLYHRKITKNIQACHSLHSSENLTGVSILKIQATLHETLNSYEFTKPFATEGLVRLMASLLMALPLIILFRMLPMTEPKKRRHSTSRSHNRRRPRRVHRDY